MLRYAITDRRLFAGDEGARRDAVLAQARRLADAGVDFLQLREKDLPRDRRLALARTLADQLRAASGPTRLLLNCGGLVPLATADPDPNSDPRPGRDPLESAFAAALRALLREIPAVGIHLPGGWTPAHLHTLRALSSSGAHHPPASPPPAAAHPLLLSVAAHTVAECRAAARAGADLILFGPVFEKRLAAADELLRGAGLGALAEATAAAQPTPVLALGGVTAENTAACLAAGAAGIAGIRLFLNAPPPTPPQH